MTGKTASGSTFRQRNWVLTALMLAMMLAAMDSTIVSTAIPQIVADLGGFHLFSWVFSIYLLAQTVTIPVYGKLADIYGRKPVLIIGSAIFLIGSAASASSWNMLSLIIFRCFQGLGAGSIMATVNTLAGDLYSLEDRARVQGWLSSVWGLSAIIGPAIGGALAQYASWRWIFLINIPIGIVAIILLVIYLREQFKHQHHQIDYAGAVFILISVGLLILGLMEGGQSWPWVSYQDLALLLLIIVFLLLAFRAEKKAAEPVMPLWLWKKRVLSGANLSMIGLGLIMMGPETYLPTFAQASLGLGAIMAGFIMAAISIGWPVASSLSGKLYLSIGFRDTSLIGMILVLISAVGFLMLPWPQSVFLLIVDQVIFGAGLGLLSTAMLVGVQSTVSWSERGVVTGTNMFCRYLGESIGAAVFGAIFNNTFNRELKHTALHTGPVGSDVIRYLESSSVPADTRHFLELAISHATQNIYTGILVFTILTILLVMIAPRKFPVVSE